MSKIKMVTEEEENLDGREWNGKEVMSDYYWCEWPRSQKYMDADWFNEEAVLDNTDPDNFPMAYFIPLDRVKEYAEGEARSSAYSQYLRAMELCRPMDILTEEEFNVEYQPDTCSLYQAHIRKRLYAKTNSQGTACPETCLCSDHMRDKISIAMANEEAWKDATGKWADVTENVKCRCIVCLEGNNPGYYE
jgi:hypothetical protein